MELSYTQFHHAQTQTSYLVFFFFKIVNVLAGTYILTNDTVIYVSGSSVRSILFRNIHISV